MNAKEIDFEKLARELTLRGFTPHIFSDAEAMKQEILRMAGTKSVGFGGSAGIDSLGIYEDLAARGNEVSWHWKLKGENDTVNGERQAAIDSDWYLCSANALTLDGTLIETDGTGNRIAALSYGPEKVMVAAAANKIWPDLQTGMAEMKKNVCSKNAKRLGLDTPCALTGECADCRSEKRICRVTALIEMRPSHIKEFHVFLLKQDLGF